MQSSKSRALPDSRVEMVGWDENRDQLAAIRRQVFVVEQAVPESLEIDGRDPGSLHAAAFVGAKMVGTGRLLPDGQIGRMAVLQPWRGRGFGSRLLAVLVEAGRRGGHEGLRLNAQIQVVPFYLGHDFQVAGENFMEAGIEHVPMKICLVR